ncbi:MAG: hypothetical protein ACKON7_13475 [Planctomycetaceae bacterium]
MFQRDRTASIDRSRWRAAVPPPLRALLVIAWCLRAAAAAPAPDPVVPGASAGLLASLPARGLAAAIAEAGRIEVPAADPRQTLVVRATQAARWTEGSYDVWHLTGGVTIQQGATEATAHEAVVWIDQAAVGPDAADEPVPRSMLARMAGDVKVRTRDESQAAVRGPTWAGRVWTLDEPPRAVPRVVAGAGAPPVYAGPAGRPDGEGAADAGTGVQQAQFSELAAPAVPQMAPAAAPARRLRAFPRSSTPLAVRWFPSPSGTEWIAVITSGVNLVVDGVDPAGPLDISADRLVIWTRGQAQPDLGGAAAQAADVPLELYMEGNVVFRQGQRVVEAANMFYDVPRSSGVITGATVLTPVDNYSGAVRLRADVLRQVDRSRFVAQQSGLTSSRLGVPSWEFR